MDPVTQRLAELELLGVPAIPKDCGELDVPSGERSSGSNDLRLKRLMEEAP